MTKPLAAWTLVGALALATVIAVAAGCGGGGGADKGLAAQAQNVSGSVSVTGIWVGEEQKSFQAVVRQHKLKPLDFARRTTLANFGRGDRRPRHGQRELLLARLQS